MERVRTFSQGKALTWADLESFDDDGYRYELLDGTLLMSPSPRPIHQRVVARLLAVLSVHCPRDLEVLPAPVDVLLAEDTVLIPDIVVGRRDDFNERGLIGAPVLAVEVISRSSRLIDQKLKPARLAAAGCPNYWIVDPNVPEMRCFTLSGGDGEYAERVHLTGEKSTELHEPYRVELSAAYLVADYPDEP
ncbi:MAG TPA: Uma2 family endonuclease [Pseudonocardiaceae bacterium]|jgi:Uma2 family endonuclease